MTKEIEILAISKHKHRKKRYLIAYYNSMLEYWIKEVYSFERTITAQKMKFSIKDFFSKCDQILRKLRIRSHLQKKSLMENFVFCAVYWETLKHHLHAYSLSVYLTVFLIYYTLKMLV